MAMVKWSPLREIMDLERNMSRVFGRPFVSMFDQPGMALTGFGPPMDVFARGNDLIMRLEIPGVSADSIHISLAEHTLTINGESKHEKEIKEEDFYRKERSFGRFERSLPVPEKITENDISASYEDGVLELIVKGAVEEEQVKEIRVQTRGERQELKSEGGAGK